MEMSRFWDLTLNIRNYSTFCERRNFFKDYYFIYLIQVNVKYNQKQERKRLIPLRFSLPLSVLLQNSTVFLWKTFLLIGLLCEYSENIQFISLNARTKILFFFYKAKNIIWTRQSLLDSWCHPSTRSSASVIATKIILLSWHITNSYFSLCLFSNCSLVAQ